MYPEHQSQARRLLIAALVVALMLAAVQSLRLAVRQSAWLQGFQAGQIAATGAANPNGVPPYLPMPQEPRPFRFLFVVAGVAFVLHVIARRRHCWGRAYGYGWQGPHYPGQRPEDLTTGSPWHGLQGMGFGGPWHGRHHGWGAPPDARTEPQATAPIQPAQPAPAAAPPRDHGPVAFV